jgi:copper chaperone
LIRVVAALRVFAVKSQVKDAMMRPPPKHLQLQKTAMQTLHFDVSGMTCGGCTSSAQRALSQLDGVGHVAVSLNPGSASVTVDLARVNAGQIEALLDELGFTAKARGPH